MTLTLTTVGEVGVDQIRDAAPLIARLAVRNDDSEPVEGVLVVAVDGAAPGVQTRIAVSLSAGEELVREGVSVEGAAVEGAAEGAAAFVLVTAVAVVDGAVVASAGGAVSVRSGAASHSGAESPGDEPGRFGRLRRSLLRLRGRGENTEGSDTTPPAEQATADHAGEVSAAVDRAVALIESSYAEERAVLAARESAEQAEREAAELAEREAADRHAAELEQREAPEEQAEAQAEPEIEAVPEAPTPEAPASETGAPDTSAPDTGGAERPDVTLTDETEFEPWAHGSRGARIVLDKLDVATNRRLVTAATVEAINAEGPIHVERLARLVAASFELRKLTAGRISDIASLIPKSKVSTEDGTFFGPVRLDSSTWRGFRSAASESRPKEHVSLHEIVNAVAAIIEHTGPMPEHTAFQMTRKVFGGKRVTPGIEARMRLAVDEGVQQGRLSLSDGMLSTV